MSLVSTVVLAISGLILTLYAATVSKRPAQVGTAGIVILVIGLILAVFVAAKNEVKSAGGPIEVPGTIIAVNGVGDLVVRCDDGIVRAVRPSTWAVGCFKEVVKPTR